MRCLFRSVFLSAWLSAIGAAPASQGSARPLWIVSNGFHTSLAIRGRDFPDAPQIPQATAADELVIGWGATHFYAGNADPVTLFQAAFGLDTSALHVVPVRGTLMARFAHSDIIEFDLPAARYREIVRAIDETFARDRKGAPVVIGAGYTPESRFYLARGRFYFPMMCNMWVARKLQQGGIHLSPASVVTADTLIHRASKIGRVLQRRSEPSDHF